MRNKEYVKIDTTIKTEIIHIFGKHLWDLRTKCIQSCDPNTKFDCYATFLTSMPSVMGSLHDEC